MKYKEVLYKKADSQAPWYTATGLLQRFGGKPRQWIHDLHQTAKDVADWATGVGTEAAYYGKGLQHLPEVDQQVWEDAAHDSSISVPRGVVRGANLAFQVGAGETRGLTDLTKRLISEKADQYLPAKNAEFTKQWLVRPLESFSAATDKAQRASNNTANAFLDYWRYQNPDRVSNKVNEVIGMAIPAAAALEASGGLSNAMRLIAPARPSDVTSIAKTLPGLGNAKGLQAAHKFLADPAFNIITNAATMGIPLTDYLYGYTHKNPGDSSILSYLKDSVARVPTAAGMLNPAAILNAKLNSSLERMEPRAEYTGRLLTDAAALAGNKNNGFVGQIIEPVKRNLIEWWNTPWYTDPYKKYMRDTLADAKEEAKETAQEIPAEVIAAITQPAATSAGSEPEQHPYKQYIKDSILDLIRNPPPELKEKQQQRLAELRDNLSVGPSEGYLRWIGVQPAARASWPSEPYTIKERSRLAKAFGRGINSGLQSQDNKEYIVGADGVELGAKAKSLFKQVMQYKMDKRPGDAVTILTQTIPELAKNFIDTIKNNQ